MSNRLAPAPTDVLLPGTCWRRSRGRPRKDEHAERTTTLACRLSPRHKEKLDALKALTGLDTRGVIERLLDAVPGESESAHQIGQKFLSAEGGRTH